MIVAALALSAGCRGQAAPDEAASGAPRVASRLPSATAAPLLARTEPAASIGAMRPAMTSLELRVPATTKPIVPSEHFDVDVWSAAVNTHTLLDENGQGAVPVSEARFLHDARNLYVAFYAGDLDLQAHATRRDGPTWKDDSFTLTFYKDDGTALFVTVSATGVVADGLCPDDARDLGDARCHLGWNSHVRVAADYDGTLNRLGDFDEEWNVQAAIPLREISTATESAERRIRFSIRRCEVAHDGPRACGFWGSANHPGELLLPATM
jgi:hypothetical protein